VAADIIELERWMAEGKVDGKSFLSLIKVKQNEDKKE